MNSYIYITRTEARLSETQFSCVPRSLHDNIKYIAVEEGKQNKMLFLLFRMHGQQNNIATIRYYLTEDFCIVFR